MGLRLGIDLCEVPRVAKVLARHRELFLARIFVAGEIDARRRHPGAFAAHVAGRFAAKEAAMKALGTGWRGVAFREIAIRREPGGRPRLSFTGRALERARRLGVRSAEVTITHTAATAAAAVALVTADDPADASPFG